MEKTLIKNIKNIIKKSQNKDKLENEELANLSNSETKISLFEIICACIIFSSIFIYMLILMIRF